ncbi:MAG: TetR/AcrR family transcriptional regulator [Gammaproteobacteria bacterium]|nr:TetR/AcrR family transcriptional regulator [Gammaproteobacteria bacterium]
MSSPAGQKTSTSSGEQAILDAAEALFAEKGFEAVSMSAIARLANTSKPNIYHHFKNKNDLYLAIMKSAVKRSSLLLDALEDAPGTFSERLADFSAGQLENIQSHPRSMQLILREALAGVSESGREIARYAVGKVFNRLVEMIRHGQQVKEFRADVDPRLAAFMIVSANMFYFQSEPIMKHIPEVLFSDDSNIFSHAVMDIFFNGILLQGEETK